MGLREAHGRRAPEVVAAVGKASYAAVAEVVVVRVERGSLLPQVFAQASVETMRSALDQGATWFAGVLAARWQLALGGIAARPALPWRSPSPASARGR